MTDKKLGIQHAKITGQVMRDHWGPIVERIADEIADPRDAFINELITENERLRNEYIKNSESHVVSNLRSIADEQAEQITRLLELLNAWTELAREHLDTELAGLTFAALRDARHG